MPPRLVDSHGATRYVLSSVTNPKRCLRCINGKEVTMAHTINRRDFLVLTGLAGAGVAGVVFTSGLPRARAAERSNGQNDFFFLQMSDTHWGFSGPPNPDAAVTLEKAVAT